jgi:broad specificity phosphatase PhoE
MSTLVLVRHGQARFGGDDYDALSDHGHYQCQALQRYWAERGETFDQLYSGSLKRQKDSAAYFGQPSVDERWNEYANDQILAHLAPRLADDDHRFRPLWQAHRADPKDPRAFQKMFEPLMLAWVAGNATHAAVETFEQFKQRIRAALQDIVDTPGSRRVAVFTSGGPIGLAVMTVLGAPNTKALELNWRIRNASLTTFLFSPGRISLDAFNATPHLKPGEETFR